MIRIPSKKDLEEQYKKENPANFSTHVHYVQFLNQISKDLKLEINREFKSKIPNFEETLVSRKILLIKFTLRSIEEEVRIISKSADFSVICCSWIPIKAYYVIFNSLLLLNYLTTCNKESLSAGHHKTLNIFKSYIKEKALLFNKDYFNSVYTNEEIQNILDWRSVSGENVKKIFFDRETRFKHILKKIINYKKREFKRNKKITSLRGKRKEEFLSNTKINLCDFFYSYRIKANYEGLDFLNQNISDYKFKDFYMNYYEFLINYYNCLRDVINKLSIVRIGKQIV